jgi:hypothetical protein
VTFTRIEGSDQSYVRVNGGVRDAVLGDPSSGLLALLDSGRVLPYCCLPGTTAAEQVNQLRGGSVEVVALRHVDLRQALESRYAVGLLAIGATKA